MGVVLIEIIFEIVDIISGIIHKSMLFDSFYCEIDGKMKSCIRH